MEMLLLLSLSIQQIEVIGMLHPLLSSLCSVLEVFLRK